MITPATRARATPRRSAGVSAGFAVAFTGFAALDRANDLVTELMARYGEDSPDLDHLDATGALEALILVALGLIVAAPMIGWLVSRMVRWLGHVAGTGVGLAAVVLLVVVPPTAFASQDGPSVSTTLGTAAAVLVGTYLGAGSLLRWSFRRVLRELGSMGTMVARVLPVLMLAVLFLFFSAEIWQIMVELSWPRTFAVIGTMGVLTALLVVVTTRDDLRSELVADSRSAGLRIPERINIVLVPVLATLIQAALFAILVFFFFLLLGWIAIPDATETRWTLRPTADLGGLLTGLPVSVTLVRVSLTLAAFSALNLAAATASDTAHRDRFVRPILDEVVHGLAAREAYLGSLKRP